MDVLNILSVSGPLPLEELVWRASREPAGALDEIANMADNGLVKLSGTSTKDLRDLVLQMTAVTGSVDMALEQVHSRFGNQQPLVELTHRGLSSTPAVA